MKAFKIIITGILLSLMSLSPALAQHNCGGHGHGHGHGQKVSAEEKATSQTEKMDVILELTPEQEAKVKEVNLKYAKKAEEAKKKMQEEREAKRAEKEAEMKKILTPEQFEKYIALKHGKKKK